MKRSPMQDMSALDVLIGWVHARYAENKLMTVIT